MEAHRLGQRPPRPSIGWLAIAAKLPVAQLGFGRLSRTCFRNLRGWEETKHFEEICRRQGRLLQGEDLGYEKLYGIAQYVWDCTIILAHPVSVCQWSGAVRRHCLCLTAPDRTYDHRQHQGDSAQRMTVVPLCLCPLLLRRFKIHIRSCISDRK